MLTYFVIAPILIAVFLYFFSNQVGKVIAIAAQFLFVIAGLYLLVQTRNDGQIVTNVGNFRSFLGIYLMADNLSAAFVLLTAIIFLAATIFSLHEKRSNLFWFLLFIWESALIGLFLTRDFFNIFVMAEVATVVVAVLLMYDRDRRRIYDGMIFLMTNVVAVQFYLFGIGYIYMITGRMDMQAAAEVIATLPTSQIYLAYALVMTAVAFKCALLPLSSWLVKVSSVPRAPVAIATILSALHVKGGIYLFIRFHSMFGQVIPGEFYIVIGAITGIIGVVLALAQKDVMLMLAYSSVAQIGLIMVALNMGQHYAYVGGVFHAINHGIFKAALFFGAGMVAQAYRTREISRLRGVWKVGKLVTIAQFLAIFGIIGAPFFNGSISKYFMAAEANLLLTSVMVTISLGTILVYLKYAQIFFGNTDNEHAKNYPDDRLRHSVVLGLGLLCFAFGIFGQQIVYVLFGYDLTIDSWGYVQKIIIFAASVAIGLVIVRFPVFTFLEERLNRVNNFGFRGICASVGVFFGAILVIAALL